MPAVLALVLELVLVAGTGEPAVSLAWVVLALVAEPAARPLVILGLVEPTAVRAVFPRLRAD